jgi:hypothetical protein
MGVLCRGMGGYAAAYRGDGSVFLSGRDRRIRNIEHRTPIRFCSDFRREGVLLPVVWRSYFGGLAFPLFCLVALSEPRINSGCTTELCYLCCR